MTYQHHTVPCRLYTIKYVRKVLTFQNFDLLPNQKKKENETQPKVQNILKVPPTKSLQRLNRKCEMWFFFIAFAVEGSDRNFVSILLSLLLLLLLLSTSNFHIVTLNCMEPYKRNTNTYTHTFVHRVRGASSNALITMTDTLLQLQTRNAGCNTKSNIYFSNKSTAEANEGNRTWWNRNYGIWLLDGRKLALWERKGGGNAHIAIGVSVVVVRTHIFAWKFRKCAQ